MLKQLLQSQKTPIKLPVSGVVGVGGHMLLISHHDPCVKQFGLMKTVNLQVHVEILG